MFILCALTMILCALTMTFKILCVTLTIVLCSPHNDFLCSCLSVMYIHNDFWMLTVTLCDLNNYVEPSPCFCVLSP